EELPRRCASLEDKPSPLRPYLAPPQHQVGNPLVALNVLIAPVVVADEVSVSLHWAHMQRRVLIAAKLPESAFLEASVCLSEGHHLGKLSSPDHLADPFLIAAINTDDEQVVGDHA